MNDAILQEMIAIRDSMTQLDCGQNIVGKSLLTLKQMRSFISSESKGIRRYIVVKEKENVKIVRIPDNSDPDIFYKQLKCVEKTKDYIVRSTKESLNCVIDNYLLKDWLDAKKSCKIITEDMKANNQIPLSYIQSYTSNMASYRREGKDRSKQILFNEITTNPRLVAIDKPTSITLYGSKVQIYKIEEIK